MHCHMAGHLQSGMGMVLDEAPEMRQLFPPPAGFPKCGTLRDTPALSEHVASAHQRWEAMVAGGAQAAGGVAAAAAAAASLW